MDVIGNAYLRAGALVHSCQPTVRRMWQQALVRRARDITGVSATRSCLVIAPHPDDETLGCGATIARKRAAGTAVKVVIAADGRHSHGASKLISSAELRAIRSAEAYEACRILGVDAADVTQLGHEDKHLEAALPALTSQLTELIEELTPEEILFPSGLDYHQDHRTLNRAVRTVLATATLRPGCHLAEYPVWHWAQGPWVDLSGRPRASRAVHLVVAPFTGMLGPAPEVVSSDGYLERKREALGAYRSQTTNLTGEPDWAVMEPELLAQFLLPYEVFFPFPAAEQARTSS